MLERYKDVIFVGLSLAIIAGIVALVSYRPPPVTITILPPEPSPTPGPLGVYVTGAVAVPNVVYQLPPGSRVQAAIDAAGGFTAEADQVAVNLALPLVDGQQLHVPVRGAASTMQAELPGGVPLTPIRINIATREELRGLPDIREDVVEAIITYRTQHGPFRSMADLDKVPGIGERTLEKWQGWVSFD